MEESKLQYILNRIGLICFLLFFALSVVMVIRNGSFGGDILSDGKRLRRGSERVHSFTTSPSPPCPS